MTQASRAVKNERIALVAGLRTPFAKQATAYRGCSALSLGSALVNELIRRSDLDPALVDLLVFGQVIQMPAAPNIAREIVLLSPLPPTTDAYSVSRACATSFQAVANVAQAIWLGQSQAGIAGGADSCSLLPIGLSDPLSVALLDLQKARSWRQRWQAVKTLRPRHFKPVPPPVAEYATGLSMGQSAEQMAQRYGIGREAQDEYALASHQKAAAAWAAGWLDDEVAPCHLLADGPPLTQDNLIRPEARLADYQALKPAFVRPGGTITAGNSSALTDGAAAVLLMKESLARAQGLTPLGYLRSLAFAAKTVQEDLLLAPAMAIPKALALAGCRWEELTLVDMHEAFAAQVLCTLQCLSDERYATQTLGLAEPVPPVAAERFNVLGGSLAYGHPFAATGARMITQTLRELQRRGGGLALTSACAAGGLGVAMVWEGA
ncbi:acetyl-CoA C-acyltransferase FadI [Pseudaeromonas paramecii]|uniref:Acetyl-CoA C-acyltransferase FadI n=1 Tax=Pseudaeromonas paramecii TaxID=2138166 RepID=A0ABP8Q388_9GAMM